MFAVFGRHISNRSSLIFAQYINRKLLAAAIIYGRLIINFIHQAGSNINNKNNRKLNYKHLIKY